MHILALMTCCSSFFLLICGFYASGRFCLWNIVECYNPSLSTQPLTGLKAWFLNLLPSLSLA